MSDKSFVTVEQHLCVVCGKPFDTGSLLLDKRMRNCFERTTLTDYGMCPEHANLKEAGYIALVGVDPEKSTFTNGNINPGDAFRTGQLLHLRASIWPKIFNLPVPPDGVAFVPSEVIQKLTKIETESAKIRGDAHAH